MPTKKKTEEITDSIMEAQNETEEQNTAPPAAEEPTEKPKRTRKKKTEITETEEQPVNETVEPQTEEKADEEAAAEPVKPTTAPKVYVPSGDIVLGGRNEDEDEENL